MNNKRTWIEKLSDFISGKGFYLVVLICVAAIALSGYYLVQGMRGSLDSALDQPVTGSAAIRETPSASPTPKPSTKPAAPSAQVTPPPAISAPPASAAAERGQTTHLHIAMYQDDYPGDPQSHIHL